ncbi:UDP-glucose/GDP-mannose dehydrogenase family, NAD binding domain [Pilibacter termitis]|uniref:UDP-glucose/GDP-mannose dehydrogenase family, NAD binding domain n=1 Tax=Pilibacter termitis TaxID=263852 RepID=A0A1T4QEM7_9ENTE|nr:hypothetical protein [Pilibacter termitis]SKA02165.1 UDP-glucose/GDP-mannose dehydrogenase family, NAD binding domain [Pilibacter termitis]
MKISILGLDSVGVANALLLGQNEDVLGYDQDEEKIRTLKRKNLAIQDDFISKFINEKKNKDKMVCKF